MFSKSVLAKGLWGRNCLGLSAFALALTASPYLAVNNANAATATSTLGVSLTVLAGCEITSVGDVEFAGTDLIAKSEPTATGTIQVKCSDGQAYSVGLGAGTGADASVTERKMTRAGGEETISYSLYRDASHTQVWGDTIEGTPNVVTGTGTGASQSYTVYGKVIAPQSPPAAGTYSDSVAITVTY